MSAGDAERDEVNIDEVSVVLVGSTDDGVLRAVGDAAWLEGVPFARVSGIQLASALTITVNGPAATVEPAKPILLRSLHANSPLPADRDTAFLRNEALSLVWSACALTPAPVINRPGLHGVSGRAVHLTPTSVHRAAAQGAGIRATPEIFSSAIPPSPPNGLEVQDLGTYNTAFSPHRPPGHGPYRTRSRRPDHYYTVVTVVGRRHWCRPAQFHRSDVGERSIEITRALDLGFACITWLVSPSGSQASIARVEPNPPSVQLAPFLADIGEALLDELLA